MKILILFATLLAVLTTVAAAQKDPKNWPEWSKNDVNKVLDKSAWGHVITNTDTSQMTYSPTSANQPNTMDGSRNQAISWSYHIRFFSAKPIRQAYARKV